MDWSTDPRGPLKEFWDEYRERTIATRENEGRRVPGSALPEHLEILGRMADEAAQRWQPPATTTLDRSMRIMVSHTWLSRCRIWYPGMRQGFVATLDRELQTPNSAMIFRTARRLEPFLGTIPSQENAWDDEHWRTWTNEAGKPRNPIDTGDGQGMMHGYVGETEDRTRTETMKRIVEGLNTPFAQSCVLAYGTEANGTGGHYAAAQGYARARAVTGAWTIPIAGIGEANHDPADDELRVHGNPTRLIAQRLREWCEAPTLRGLTPLDALDHWERCGLGQGDGPTYNGDDQAWEEEIQKANEKTSDTIRWLRRRDGEKDAPTPESMAVFEG